MKPKPETFSDRWWFPSTLFVIHAIAVLVFSFYDPDLAGPHADAGSMVWLFWVWADSPLGFVALFLTDLVPTNVLAISCVVIFGGLQWVIWGVLIQKIRRALLGLLLSGVQSTIRVGRLRKDDPDEP